MLIPHSEKGIFSFISPTCFISSVTLFALVVVGLFAGFRFRIKSRFDYYHQENQYYKNQIDSIHTVLPNIAQSQKNLSGRLYSLFEILGISYQEDALGQLSQDQESLVSGLDNIEARMGNISNYIQNFKKTFSEIPSIFPLLPKYWFPFWSAGASNLWPGLIHPAMTCGFPFTPFKQWPASSVCFWRGIRSGGGSQPQTRILYPTHGPHGSFPLARKLKSQTSDCGILLLYRVSYSL